MFFSGVQGILPIPMQIFSRCTFPLIGNFFQVSGTGLEGPGHAKNPYTEQSEIFCVSADTSFPKRQTNNSFNHLLKITRVYVRPKF